MTEVSEQEVPERPEAEVEAESATNAALLPFGFAKRHGIVVLPAETSSAMAEF